MESKKVGTKQKRRKATAYVSAFIYRAIVT